MTLNSLLILINKSNDAPSLIPSFTLLCQSIKIALVKMKFDITV